MPPPGGYFTLKLPSAETRAQFQSTPWALKILDDPTLQAFTNESRLLKPKTTADTFVSKTLATEDTIRAWQCFHKAPDSRRQYGEILSLLSIGSGVNGHINTSHGGFVSLLHDESLGLAAENLKPSDKTTMTAYLKVDYKKPLKTPNVVLCRAWGERREGKKLYVRGTMEDGEGNVLSTSEGLFIVLDRAKLRENL
jgi:acyl-coenzyme A thioesterase PaaI-like protein